MKFRLEIDMTNAAFDDEGRGPEVARILKNVADFVMGRYLDKKDTIALYDINGNECGQIKIGGR